MQQYITSQRAEKATTPAGKQMKVKPSTRMTETPSSTLNQEEFDVSEAVKYSIQVVFNASSRIFSMFIHDLIKRKRSRVALS